MRHCACYTSAHRIIRLRQGLTFGLRQRCAIAGALATLFLKLGMTASGGPAAHIAMIHDETVKRRRWLSDQEFLDLVGATNLIPGPNSTEMAIHVGFLRAGWRGLIVGGLFHYCGLAWFDGSRDLAIGGGPHSLTLRF